MLGNIYLNYLLLDYDIDHNNYSNPLTLKARNTFESISPTVFRKIYVYVSKIFYTTDSGLFFDQEHTKEIYQIFSSDSTYDLRNTATIPGAFSQFYFCQYKKNEIFQRSYEKFQTTLAKISGMAKAINSIAAIIVITLTKNFYHLEILNNFYQRSIDKNEDINIKESGMEINKLVISTYVKNMTDDGVPKKKISGLSSVSPIMYKLFNILTIIGRLITRQ
jgi:hypothetical protein